MDTTTANTRNTPPEPRPFGRRPFRSLDIAASCLIGVALLALAGPRLGAALDTAPGDRFVRVQELGRPVDAAGLSAIMASREAANRWVVSPTALKEIGLAGSELLARGEVSAEREPEVRRTTRLALERGLARAPADPVAWTRLAYLETIEKGPTPRAAEAIRLSILTGPREPQILLPRLDLALIGWRVLDDDTRRLVLDQIRIVWTKNPTGLAELARKRNAVAVVRATLVEQPDWAARFDALIAGGRPIERKT